MPVAVGLRRGGPKIRRSSNTAIALSFLLAITLIVGNLLAIAPVSAQANEPFATASVVPADVLLYTVVPLRGNESQWEQTLTLLERAGLGPTVDAARADVLGSGTDEELPLELFLGGEVALVVSDVAAQLLINESLGGVPELPATPEPTGSGTLSNANESGLAFVITAESPAFIALSLEAAIADTAEQLGVDVQQIEHEGIIINYVDVPEDSDATPMATARAGDFILAAGFPADLEPLIETSNGDRESLADLDAFAEVRSALDQEHLAFGFTNAFPSETLRQGLGEAGIPVGFTPGQSSAGGFLIAADEPGLRLETVSLGVNDSGTTTSTFPDSTVLAQTPSDVMLFFAASNLAGTGVLDSVGAFLLSASGIVPGNEEAGSLDELLADQFEQLAQTFGVNFRTDLLQQLTGEFGFWLQYDPRSGAVNALFASGVDDAEAVSGALFQITLLVQSAGGGEMSVTTRPIGDDDRVFSILTGDPIVPLIEYGVVGDQMVVGLGRAVDNVGDGPESPLADQESYQAIMAALPEATDGIFYLDLQQAIPVLTRAAEDTGVDEIAEDLAGGDGASQAEATAIAAETGDANPECAQYESQADAQAAYNSFAAGSFQLDQDFDGEACEDFFNPGAATPASAGAGQPAATSTPEPIAAVSPATMTAFTAFGMVAYVEDGNSRTSSLLLVSEPED